MPPENAVVDVEQVVAEIKAEVARKREAGEYPVELLRRLEVSFDPVPPQPALVGLAHIETVRPMHSARPVLGRVAVETKRVVRRAIAWYVRPIAADQSRFNFAATRRIQDLEERVILLEEELSRLARRGDTDGR